jgi:hypothetical protein
MIARWLSLLAPLLLLLAATPAAADPLEGSWALDAGGATIFRFDLSKDADGKWHGSWSKPTTFASDGNHFARLKGPVKVVKSMTGLDTPDGIELSFDDPRPGALPDIFDFKAIDPDAIEMTYVGTGLAPFMLERVKPEHTIGPWDPAATYTRAGHENDATTGKLSVGVSEGAADGPPAADPESFRLKPGAPVGR